mgnify:FL=1
MNYLSNAFSLQMLKDLYSSIETKDVPREDIPADCKSLIGHQDLADYLGVPMNREQVKLEEDDVLYVVQYVGGRLPEGTTNLATEQFNNLVFVAVTVKYFPNCWDNHSNQLY